MPTPELPATGRRVYVLCEGQYQVPSAALTVYLPGKDSVYLDAFGAANEPGWGDVAQSLFFTSGEIFICVNNSDRILVADRLSLKLKHVISVRKPRYVQRISDDAAVVSTLFSNTLYRISLKNYAVTDSLQIPRSNPEGLTAQNGLLYVCPWDAAADKIYVVADGTSLVDSITVGAAPHTIELDGNGKAWVLSGNASAGMPAKLTRVNLATQTVEASFSFPAAADPVRLSFNSTRDTLYYIGIDYAGGHRYNGVYRMDIGASALPGAPFIAAGPRSTSGA